MMPQGNATAYAKSDEKDHHHHVKPVAPWEDLRWPTSVKEIIVRFQNGSYEQKHLVASLVRENYNTIPMSVQFRFLLEPNGVSDIRIMFIKEGAFGSYEGVVNWDIAKHLPTMRLNLNSKNLDENQNTILHEFGHALCLKHEHQHPGSGIRLNRRTLLKRRNMTDEHIDAHYEIQPSKFAPWRIEPYDRRSIMHYSFRKGELLDSDASILVNPSVSQGDRNQLLRMYPMRKAHKLKSASSTTSSSKLTPEKTKTMKKESWWANFLRGGQGLRNMWK